MQLSKSASLKRGGGLVTPESRVNVVGVNCGQQFTNDSVLIVQTAESIHYITTNGLVDKDYA